MLRPGGGSSAERIRLSRVRASARTKTSRRWPAVTAASLPASSLAAEELMRAENSIRLGLPG